MKCPVIDLAQWRAEHPPLFRLWMAQSKCLIGCARLFSELWGNYWGMWRI